MSPLPERRTPRKPLFTAKVKPAPKRQTTKAEEPPPAKKTAKKTTKKAASK